ncbi:hypothetical protein Tco_1462507 [Tanacetum coccineum]
MHNNIMAAGIRDHPPMLATGRYAQWQSRFMRYVDTKPNGEALRKCILQGPYKHSTVTIPGQPATEESLKVEEQTVLETFSNISPENKVHYDAEKDAIHLIMTGIGDDIYFTDVKTSLFWEFGRFTSRDGESFESYYSKFYKMMNEMVRNQLEVATIQVNVQFLQQLQLEWSRFVTVVKQTINLDKEWYHKLFDILKLYQKEVNEIRAEKIARNANPLALVIAKPITPPSESDSEEDNDPEQAQKDKDMQIKLALIAKYFKKLYKPTNNNLRTSLNSRNKNVVTPHQWRKHGM